MDKNKNGEVKITVKNKVAYMLTKYPEMRDDKLLLCKAIWQKELDKLLPLHITVSGLTSESFMNYLVSGAISSSETICRWSRMLQNSNPELRGKEYDKRHNIEVEQAKMYLD